MLVGVISGPSFNEVRLQIQKVLPYAEALEFRFDLWETVPFSHLETLRNQIKIPLVFTCRAKKGLKENNRISFLKTLLKLRPEYVDLEETVSEKWFSYFSTKTKVICSYHNFIETPADLAFLLKNMKKKRASVYKICTFANSSLDALQMLNFVSNNSNITGMCMGPFGQITRILGPIVGNIFTYGCVDEPVALGQISLKELCDVYSIKSLNAQTKIYALIGDPVAPSIGHLFHNQIFALKKLNKIYVKISIKEEELSSFFSFIEPLPFYGFSVTMPLKECILNYAHCDEDVLKIGAANTLLKAQSWMGKNTDGKGACLAIENHMNLTGKKIILIGAGGVARSIVQKLIQKKAEVTLLNRTPEKAIRIANLSGAKGGPLDTLPDVLAKGADLIINTVPDTSSFLSILPSCQCRPTIMDVRSFPVVTDFLFLAKQLGYPHIYGYEMFIQQAVLQQKYFSMI